MPFLELTFAAPDGSAAQAEEACFGLGALAVTLRDAADHAILEPAPGATPLWPQVRVTALFAADADPKSIRRSLCTAIPGLADGDIEASELADRPWEREWLRDFHAMPVRAAAVGCSAT